MRYPCEINMETWKTQWQALVTHLRSFVKDLEALVKVGE